MKSNLFNVGVKVGRVNQKHVRIAIAVGTLILLVLGSGAPGGVSDF